MGGIIAVQRDSGGPFSWAFIGWSSVAEHPEIEDDDLSSQVGKGEFLAARVEPSALADELGGANACT
ncbi:hypothetical protein [Streptacidiphilus rugosus]|uniref:hypothetical protein n=1 Tax=Streptacidiphilus rugosus TaxID=405783 RepID=UPI0018DC8855|nr:hypothetical protein [Streptacidiphilus rugosus]